MPRPKSIPPASPPKTSRFIATLFALLLVALLIPPTRYALTLLSITPEFAQAGDFFGYLQMAEDLRTGAAPNHLQKFTFDSPHARLLLAHFKSQNLPLNSYSELLAPNAYHYHPRSNLIANQYPPHASPEARKTAFQFIANRDDPIYLLYDNPALDPIFTELKQQGATLQEVATFADRPVLQLHWPVKPSPP